MLPNTLKIDSTHQDKNDELNSVGLYFHEKCHVSVMPFLTSFSVTLTLIHYITALYYAFGSLTTE